MGNDASSQRGLGLSLINQLGSCDKSSRDEALRLLLESWLPSQPYLTDDIMNELLKGLFYSVWYADFQSLGLIDRLSSILPRLHNSSLSLHYFSSFLLTMRREWPGIDALRLENFYLFIRRFLHHSFAFLKIHSWDLDLTSRLISLLKDTCFPVKQGNSFGVSYPIASVFLEELRPFLPLRPEVSEAVFKPFISVLGSLPDKVLLGKIKNNMFDVLLKMGTKLLEVKKLGDYNDDAVVLGTIALTMGFSNKFFELGYSVDCLQGNRKVLFVLYVEFLKLEKNFESSGIQLNVYSGSKNFAHTLDNRLDVVPNPDYKKYPVQPKKNLAHTFVPNTDFFCGGKKYPVQPKKNLAHTLDYSFDLVPNPDYNKYPVQPKKNLVCTLGYSFDLVPNPDYNLKYPLQPKKNLAHTFDNCLDVVHNPDYNKYPVQPKKNSAHTFVPNTDFIYGGKKYTLRPKQELPDYRLDVPKHDYVFYGSKNFAHTFQPKKKFASIF